MPCVGFDCIGCDAEHLANVSTITAEGDKVEDLLFALRKPVGRSDARRGRLKGERATVQLFLGLTCSTARSKGKNKNEQIEDDERNNGELSAPCGLNQARGEANKRSGKR